MSAVPLFLELQKKIDNLIQVVGNLNSAIVNLTQTITPSPPSSPQPTQEYNPDIDLCPTQEEDEVKYPPPKRVKRDGVGKSVSSQTEKTVDIGVEKAYLPGKSSLRPRPSIKQEKQ